MVAGPVDGCYRGHTFSHVDVGMGKCAYVRAGLGEGLGVISWFYASPTERSVVCGEPSHVFRLFRSLCLSFFLWGCRFAQMQCIFSPGKYRRILWNQISSAILLFKYLSLNVTYLRFDVGLGN